MTTPLLTTGTVNEVQVRFSGDVGGIGLSRFRFIRNDAGVTTVADCNAAGAAVRAFLGTLSYWPTGLSVAVQAQVPMYDIGSALVQGYLTMTSIPSNIAGSSSGSYGAGLGLRVNWKTNTISGRRMLKGASYLVPVSSGAFSGNGGVNSVIANQMTGAATTYINAMTTANLVPVIWHRPLVGETSGGIVGVITSGITSLTPSGLRSRRT